jgi:hypothetical protein
MKGVQTSGGIKIISIFPQGSVTCSELSESLVRRDHLDNPDVDKKVLNGIIVQSGVNTFNVMD